VVLDHRTDLYSLGVTLYELLTGQPAVGGSSREEILRQIVFAEPWRPRQRNKAIPPDLETVVLKAMAPEPERRYGTAQELADDLRRFLADQPVQARRPTWTEKAVRWVLRHKLAVRAGLWTILLALLVSLASNVLIWQAQRRADDALRMSEARRQEAEEALRRMRLYQAEVNAAWAESRSQQAKLDVILKSVNRVVGAAGEHDPGGGASGSERSLHEAVSKIYQALLPPLFDPDGTPAGRPTSYAGAWDDMRLGNALTQLGKFSEAKAAYAVATQYASAGTPPVAGAAATPPVPPAAVLSGYRRALAVWRTRARAEGHDFLDGQLLAVVQLYLTRARGLAASAREQKGPNKLAREAEQTYATGLALLLTDLPNLSTERGRSELLNYARGSVDVFIKPSSKGHVWRGRAECQKVLLAVLTWDRATALDPSMPAEEVLELARQYWGLGNSLYQAGLPYHGLEVLHKAASVFEKLQDDLPKKLEDLERALTFVREVASLLKGKGKDTEAERLYRLGIAIWKKSRGKPPLAAEPKINGLGVWFDAVALHNELGQLLACTYQFQQAEAVAREGLALTQAFPQDYLRQFRSGLGEVVWYGQINSLRYTLATALRCTGRTEEAERCLKQVRAIIPDTVPKSAQEGYLERYLWQSFQLGRRLLGLGFGEEARHAFRQAIRNGQELPAAAVERIARAELCQLPERKCYAAAVGLYGEAFAIEPKLTGDLPSIPRSSAACAAALAGCGQGKDADKLDARERARPRR
jgi:tetratricopeptide (TPR) repeat protein